jgi:hypothetical protein
VHVRDGDLITYVWRGGELAAGEACQLGTHPTFIVHQRQYNLAEEGHQWIRGWHPRTSPEGQALLAAHAIAHSGEGQRGVVGPTGPTGPTGVRGLPFPRCPGVPPGTF